MPNVLVEKLRTCSREERKALAIESARIGANEVVTELIRMIEGKYRRGLRWYDSDDQLIGVEAAGGARGNTHVLIYLKNLLVNEDRGKFGPVCYCRNDVPKGIEISNYIYVNAKRGLRNALNYSPGCSSCESGAYENPNRQRALSTISAAITKLEKTVQNAPPTQ